MYLGCVYYTEGKQYGCGCQLCFYVVYFDYFPCCASCQLHELCAEDKADLVH